MVLKLLYFVEQLDVEKRKNNRRKAIQICDEHLGVMPRDTVTLRAINLARDMAKPETVCLEDDIYHQMYDSFETAIVYDSDVKLVFGAMAIGFEEISKRLYFGQIVYDVDGIIDDVIEKMTHEMLPEL